jgi:ectoine hydroxylase-related dioxygenase (phytanoyl-CoA dioxygenase family)
MLSHITEEQYKKYDEDGYLIFKNVISEDSVKKSIQAYKNIRNKCETYKYLCFRKFKDIALNDIYGIEHIFHPDIFEEDLFSSLMESGVLELSRKILGDDEIFLSRNRIHCTKNISHSGNWHRDGPTGMADETDNWLKKSEKDMMWLQATLPYYPEDGFYIVPGSHKDSNEFISTREVLGTKKILKNEKRLKIYAGDLILFNPYLIHRGTCVGRQNKQRAHIHMRFTRKKFDKIADRYRKDSEFFKSTKVFNYANESWKRSFNLNLENTSNWYGDEIVQKKPNLFNPKFYILFLLILCNKSLYYLSRLYPFSQRSLENITIIKYPYLKDIE